MTLAVRGSLSALIWNGNNTSATATFTAADGFAGTGSVSVVSFTDTTGNAGTGGSDTVSIDTENPTVVVDILDLSLIGGDNSSLVKFTFSEVPTGFTNAGVTFVGGTLTAVTQDLVLDPTGKIYTATFTATDGFNGSGLVSVKAGSYTDAAGNLGGPSNIDTVQIETSDPNNFNSLGTPGDNTDGDPDAHSPQTVYGGTGNDIILGGTGADTLYGGSGNDTITGNNGAETIFGGSGNDTIDGGNGPDTIIGGWDGDNLTGGLGVDIFKYLSVIDSRAGAFDTINFAPDSGAYPGTKSI